MSPESPNNQSEINPKFFKLGEGNITEKGVVETLVLEQRKPTIRKIYRAKDHSLIGVFVEVPPPGTQLGDTRNSIIGTTAAEYVSPQGIRRGYSDTYAVTPEQLTLIEQRIIKAKKQFKRNTSI